MNNSDITITIKANSALFTAAMKEAAAQTKNLDPTLQSAAGSMKGLGDSYDKTSGTISAKSAAIIGAVSGLVSSAASSVASFVSSQLSDAVNRFDTIQNFPKVMQNFGVSSKDATAAMDTLTKGVQTLPTSLNSIVSLTEAFTPMSAGVKQAASLALALNDALLAGGAPMDVQSAAMEQFRQALAKGMPQLQDWRSLETAMPAQLQQVAKALGLGSGALKDYGANGQGLYNAMQDGKISMDDFNNSLLNLDKNGLNGLPNFQQQAKNASNGVGTAFTVLKQNIQQVMVDIMTSIGQQNISNAIKSVGTAIKDAYGYAKDMFTFIDAHKTIFSTLAVGIGAATAAIIAWGTYVKIASVVTAAYSAVTTYLTLVQSLQAQGLGVLRAAWMALNIVMDANPIGLIIIAVVALVAALVYFFTQTKTGQAIVKTVFKAIGGFISDVAKIASSVASSVSGFFKAAWNDIKGVWNAVVGFFQGIWNGVTAVFNAVVGFFQKWGITIIAVAFWPITLAVGAIIKYWQPITAFFSAIWQGIVAVFTPVITFFTTLFQLAWAGIKLVWDGVVLYYTTIWNGIVAVFNVVSGWFTAIFTAAWNGIVAVWNVVASWFAAVWNGIVAVFSPVVSWFAGIFRAAWEGIKAVFSGVGSFFKGVWNTVTSIFSTVGSSVANAVGGAIKGVVNSALSIAESTINGFIGLINGAIHIMNHVPGVHIPDVGKINLPQLASGGIVAATPGGQAITVAEGGQDEWVVPESKMASVVQQLAGAAARKNNTQATPQQTNNEYNIQVSVTVQNDGTDFTDAQATSMAKKIANALRAQGLSINEMGALRT